MNMYKSHQNQKEKYNSLNPFIEINKLKTE